MANRSRLRQAVTLGVAGVALSSTSTVALAQAATESEKKAASTLEEVVVTGTMIRGVAPVGSNVVGVSRAQIEASGAENTQQLLATMPQNSSFNNLVATLPAGGVITSNNRVPIARPNLRNLPGCGGAGSGACTLILIDGRRVVPEGIQQIAVDPSVVPPGILERVETILDGNSAIYGSDAVGGVINFITKKRYDGTQVDAHFGFADSYKTYDADITSGKAWDSGSIIFSYSYGKHDALFGGDRSYVHAIQWLPLPAASAGLPTGRACNSPNISVGAATYASLTSAAGTFNTCDASKDATLYPSEVRHNAYMVFSQDITDNVKFDLDAFYTTNEQTASPGPLTGNAAISTKNPYYTQIPGTAAGAAQTVQFSYAPIFGRNGATNQTNIQVGQVTPTLTVDVGDWQIRTLFSYGHSKTTYDNNVLNTGLQSILVNPAVAIPPPPTALTTAAINPYNIAATLNQTAFGGLQFHDRGDGVNEFINARSIADGKLFALPGGDVHAAVGLEYYNDRFKARTTNATSTLLTSYTQVSQDAKSVFGELFVPIVGGSNRIPGISSLNLSVSGRYDKYEDIPGKFDPKFGLTYDPVEWITVRGNWGKSFNAPTPADLLGSVTALVRAIQITPQNAPAFTPTGTYAPGSPTTPTYFLAVSGTAPGLQPQTATNWSFGADFSPPSVPNLIISATYYNIVFENIISLPTPTGDQQVLFRNFPELYQLNVAGLPASVVNAFAALAPASGPAAVASAAGTIVETVDGRTRNLGVTKLSGYDFSLSYSHQTGFGSVDARVGGNYQKKRKSQLKAGGPVQDDMYILGFSPFNGSMTLGTSIRNFRAQATWNYTAGYKLAPSGTLDPTQTRLAGFSAVNLFFRYAIDGSGLAKDLAVTLGVDNVRDAEPPIYRNNGGTGVAPNIRTLGRVTQVGVSKKF